MSRKSRSCGAHQRLSEVGAVRSWRPLGRLGKIDAEPFCDLVADHRTRCAAGHIGVDQTPTRLSCVACPGRCTLDHRLVRFLRRLSCTADAATWARCRLSRSVRSVTLCLRLHRNVRCSPRALKKEPRFGKATMALAERRDLIDAYVRAFR